MKPVGKFQGGKVFRGMGRYVEGLSSRQEVMREAMRVLNKPTTAPLAIAIVYAGNRSAALAGKCARINPTNPRELTHKPKATTMIRRKMSRS